VANMTEWNNTKLASLIENILEMINRAIDKAFSLIHASIQNLAQRVSALKDINAGEVIAALRAYIGKEDLEDERAETDKEPFEDVYMTKGRDEDGEVQIAT
ncbi:hypothetical protein HAX54_001866, partial [Datura stramonium]|nr:hypothetical protein [Datura stramonium]